MCKLQSVICWFFFCYSLDTYTHYTDIFRPVQKEKIEIDFFLARETAEKAEVDQNNKKVLLSIFYLLQMPHLYVLKGNQSGNLNKFLLQIS